MQLRQAERRQAKMKMAIQGAAGAGKTFSALLLSYGLVKDWSRIVVIDTENGSADLYAHLGDYNVLALPTPYSPENYMRAIQVCEQAGMEVIIIDSISHCWDFLLEYHSLLPGNSFANWSKVTPRQKMFMDAILRSECHIISTMRVKQDYVLNQKDGKAVPEKVGLKAIQRDGVEYEFTIVFDLAQNHFCKASKDRTGLFADKPEFVISEKTGETIREWCHKGISLDEIRNLVQASDSLDGLRDVYNQYRSFFPQLEEDFRARKSALSPLNFQTLK